MKMFSSSNGRVSICLCIAIFCFGASVDQGIAGERHRFRLVNISNTQPSRDSRGEIIDTHDGCLQFFNGRYYLYGTAYDKSSRFTLNNRFRVYSSPDLEHWSFEGELLHQPPNGYYYRPHVAYNPNTRKYVLWYNWYPTLFDGKVGAAVSDTPGGPFKIVTASVKVSQAADQPGDGSLFVDNDGTGYFIYSVIGQNHGVRIDRLTPDFLGSTAETSKVLGYGVEAPTLFRHHDRYYALFDSTCCFCSEGSGARVFVAAASLGPYTERANINRRSDGRPIVAAQQTFVADIPTSSGSALLWMADRWGSRADDVNGHDLQFWSAPLRFTTDGSIEPINDVAEWRMLIQVGKRRAPIKRPYSWPKKRDPNPLKTDPCSGAALPPEG